MAEGLSKTYRGDVRALEGLSFTARRGEILGLLGPNGAGKSTTVRILATLTHPDGGRASIAGHDVVTESAAVRSRIGLVAQASGVDRYATARENLTLQAQLQRVPTAAIAPRVDRLLALVGLVDAADRMVNTFSGGMKRRLDIAMGLVHEPDVLFLDEPTTGLDPETRAALWHDLEQLRRERNLTVLLTTHYLEEADRLCDRVAIIDHGRVVIQGTPAELKAAIIGDAVTLGLEEDARPAAALLAGFEGVVETIVSGNNLIVRVANGASSLPGLVTELEHGGHSVCTATVSRPSLDDVYLYHTGRRFADDDAAGSNAAVGKRTGGDAS